MEPNGSSVSVLWISLSHSSSPVLDQGSFHCNPPPHHQSPLSLTVEAARALCLRLLGSGEAESGLLFESESRDH